VHSADNLSFDPSTLHNASPNSSKSRRHAAHPNKNVIFKMYSSAFSGSKGDGGWRCSNDRAKAMRAWLLTSSGAAACQQNARRNKTQGQ
jgi:hypothetical protein